MGHHQHGVVYGGEGGCGDGILFGFKRENNAGKGKVSERRALHKYCIEDGTLI